MASVFVFRSMTMMVFFLMFFASVIVIEILKETLVDGDTGSNGTRALDTLRLVIVVSSHGNSGAAADYPGDPYPLTDPTFWPFGSLQLSPGSRVKMYSLGTKVRGLYQGFLSQTYRPGDTIAASTAVDRVVISGQAFLSGLYPPPHHRRKHKDVTWQPAPLYTDSPDHSTVLYIDGTSSDLEPSVVDLPECGNPCDFYTLANITRNFTSGVNFHEECNVSSTPLSTFEKQQSPYLSSEGT